MTVAELIAKLSEEVPNARVLIDTDFIEVEARTIYQSVNGVVISA